MEDNIMKSKLIILTGIAFMVLLSLLFLANKDRKYQKAEKEKAQDNVEVLELGAKDFTVRDSLSAKTIKQMQFDLDDFKAYRAEDAKMIKDLNIQLKTAKSFTNVRTFTGYEIRQPTYDSIVYLDNRVADTLNCIKYKDAFIDLDLCMSDSAIGHVELYSDLKLVISQPKKQWFIFKWGIESTNVTGVALNPHTKIGDISYTIINK